MLKNIKKNVPLAPYTTFKIGGKAKYFYTAKNEKDLAQILAWAKENNLPVFILGGGSNVLVSDQGFDGLVIKISNQKFQIKNQKIFCGAGASLSDLVRLSIEKGFKGLEWAAGIPGTVGGAVRGNAGAFGSNIGQSVIEVKTYKHKNIQTYKHKNCRFGYRESIFKKDRNLIIVSVVLKLKKSKKGEKKQQLAKISEILKSRKEKQPSLPSAGSVFKNIIVKNIGQKNIERISTEAIKNGMLPAGWLIEEVELKGKKIGGAQISEKHANFIVNSGKAKSSEVMELISFAKTRVRDQFGIQLEEEIEYVGF